jgi:tRNA (uracil-5-)-methyltransferase TRM9
MQPLYRSTAQETWDAIAKSFDTTRTRPWDICLEFIESLHVTDTVADIGCGNGRHLFPCAKQCSTVIGVDISSKMLQLVQAKLRNSSVSNVSLLHADAVHIPIPDRSLDAVLFIASLHNIQGKEHRLAALREVARVLKPQGQALVSVWSRWQDKFYKQTLQRFIRHPCSSGDITMLWKQHKLNVPRFYHLYGRGEFIAQLHAAGVQIDTVRNVRIHSKRFPDNYFALVRRK